MMLRTVHKERVEPDPTLEAGIEWIVARQLAPIEDELLRLRAYVEALRDVVEPR